MSNVRAFPPEIQAVAGKFEDKWFEFSRRDPANPRYEVRHAGEQAVNLLGDLIDKLVEYRGMLGRQVDDYKERFKP